MGNHSEIKEGKPIYKKWWFWIIVVAILAIISSNKNTNTTQVSSNGNSRNSIVNSEEKQKAEVKQETEEEKAQRLEQERIAKEQEETEFKEQCEEYTYEELARNPDKIKGKKVKLTGEVIQTLQGNSSVDLRINITKSEYDFYTDTIYGVYVPEEGEDKILENDIVTIWGVAQGDYLYSSVLGSIVNLPLISINYIEIQK